MTARHQIRVGRLGRDRSPIDAMRAPTVGEMLQGAREKKGVDLYRAERDTKIRARHLAALESGDYGELPGSVYTKGFLRNYALYLALDPEEILGRWRDEQDFGRKGEPVTVAAPPMPIAEPHRGFTFTPGVFVAAILTVVVLGFAAYIGLQLVRFSQPQQLALDGPARLVLPAEATTFILRGTSGPRAIVNISDASGAPVKTASADDAGAWLAELAVSKGRNTFTIVSRDPETGRESQPLSVIADVPVPGASQPSSTPAPGQSGSPGATPGPGASGGMAGSAGPGASALPPGAARLELSQPADGARVKDGAIGVLGTSDAGTVRVSAQLDGEGDVRPPDPSFVKVRDGSFETELLLPAGRWIVTVTTAGSSAAPASVSRSVDVDYSGLFVAVEARGGSAWIQVWVDNEVAEVGHTFRNRERELFDARRSVVVSSGSLGTTFVTVNGEAYGFLGEGANTGSWVFEKGKPPRQLE
jgi:cytoskeletal protein RodZ